MFLFDGELKDADELIENIGKKKKVPRSSSSIKSSNHEIHHQQQQDHDANASKPLQVSILQLCNVSMMIVFNLVRVKIKILIIDYYGVVVLVLVG